MLPEKQDDLPREARELINLRELVSSAEEDAFKLDIGSGELAFLALMAKELAPLFEHLDLPEYEPLKLSRQEGSSFFEHVTRKPVAHKILAYQSEEVSREVGSSTHDFKCLLIAEDGTLRYAESI